MKYPKIATSLGWTETPSTEGIFLQPVEAEKIEQKLTDAEAAVITAASAADTAAQNATVQAGRIAELEGQLTEANTSKDTIANQLSTVNGQLSTAKTEIARLEALETTKPSGTVTSGDPEPGPSAADKNKKYLCAFDHQFGN